MTATVGNCRWCAIGVERKRNKDGMWQHLRRDPKPYLLLMGYAKEKIEAIGDQWMEVNNDNNTCKSMHKQEEK